MSRVFITTLFIECIVFGLGTTTIPSPSWITKGWILYNNTRPLGITISPFPQMIASSSAPWNPVFHLKRGLCRYIFYALLNLTHWIAQALFRTFHRHTQCINTPREGFRRPKTSSSLSYMTMTSPPVVCMSLIHRENQSRSWSLPLSRFLFYSDIFHSIQRTKKEKLAVWSFGPLMWR